MRLARRLGFDHTALGAWHHVQHVWRNPSWLVEVEVWPDSATVMVTNRAVGRHEGRFIADTPVDAARILSALGVLPTLESAA